MKPSPPAAPYVSGHCGIRRHRQCTGRYAGATCACHCHTVCPTCGQPLPAGEASP